MSSVTQPTLAVVADVSVGMSHFAPALLYASPFQQSLRAASTPRAGGGLPTRPRALVVFLDPPAARTDLVGSIERDLALWFMLVGIFAANVGVVTHREVVHSYVVVGRARPIFAPVTPVRPATTW